MDCTFLRGIELWTRLGVPVSERSKPQRVLVDIEIFHPTKSVAEDDDVTAGIDYEKVTAAVVELALVERKTIERLSEDIASCVLERWKPQGGVKVSVRKKPNLPLSSACVTISRP